MTKTRYLGFRLERPNLANLYRWVAWRAIGGSRVLVSAPSQAQLKKYLRAIRAAERTGVIR